MLGPVHETGRAAWISRRGETKALFHYVPASVWNYRESHWIYDSIKGFDRGTLASQGERLRMYRRQAKRLGARLYRFEGDAFEEIDPEAGDPAD